MNISATGRHGAALNTQEQRGEEIADFSFRCVVRSELNFSYFPGCAGKYSTNCINVTTLPNVGGIVLTFYTDTVYPEEWPHIPGCGKCELIRGHNDHRHLPITHKRRNSWDAHYHVMVKPEHCDAFLHRTLKIIDLSPDDQSQLKLTAKYLSDNSFEPGLTFKDGSYAENGGAHSMYDSQRNLRHLNGPLKLLELSPASVSELNALPGQDET